VRWCGARSAAGSGGCGGSGGAEAGSGWLQAGRSSRRLAGAELEQVQELVERDVAAPTGADGACCGSARCGSATRASRERRGSWRCRHARRRSCGGGLLREMRQHGGIDRDYATVIKIGRIEDASMVFDEMLAAGKVKLSLRSGSRSRMRTARTCADVMRQGRSECVSSSRKRRSSCTACRTTVCREVTRGAGGAAVRRLRADPHESSGVARDGRWRPSRRRQWKARP
jgi:hypothetical protein